MTNELLQSVKNRSSSFVRVADYNAENQELLVELGEGKRKYVYVGVPESEIEAINTAPSVGKYFNSIIAKKYKYKHSV